jgi:hypothetical protein
VGNVGAVRAGLPSTRYAVLAELFAAETS